MVPEQKSKGEATSGSRDREVTVISATALAPILRFVRGPRSTRSPSRNWSHATSVRSSHGGSSRRKGSATSGSVLPASSSAWADGRYAAPMKGCQQYHDRTLKREGITHCYQPPKLLGLCVCTKASQLMFLQDTQLFLLPLNIINCNCRCVIAG